MCLNEKNVPTTGDYFYISDQKLMISKKHDVRYLCEYIPNVTQITEETSNDFELELTDDANKFLAYKVAGDLLKTDPSVDYRAFEQRVNAMFSNFDTTTKEISVTIGEGEL
jgi:succinylglutamate desuccinylase